MPKVRIPSLIWNYFDIDDGVAMKAICKYCKNNISYKSTITNLKLHLRKKHIGVYEEFCRKEKPTNQRTLLRTDTLRSEHNVLPLSEGNQQLAAGDSGGSTSGNVPSTSYSDVNKQIQESIPSTSIGHISSRKQTTVSSFIPRNLSVSEKSKIDKWLLKLITQDFQPFSIVENEGFKGYTKALNPNYVLPHRKTLSNSLLLAEYKTRIDSVKELVNNFCRTICITTDCWTSRNVVSYIAFTGHFINIDTLKYESILIECSAMEGSHTSANISIVLRRIAEEWKIANKINFFVTDNASNMTSAANLLGWNHFGCYVHKLNLIVQDALNLQCISTTIQKVQRTVAYFKRSALAKEKLLKYQINAQNVPPGSAKGLLISIPTRWNSTYLMLSRFADLQEALRATIPNLIADLPIIPMEEWQSIDQLIEVLKPFYEVTKIMSGEEYLSASKALVITQGLNSIFENLMSKNYYSVIKDVVRQLKKGLDTRLGDLERNEAVGICTYLDPRFKEHAFIDRDALATIKCVLLEKIAELLNDDNLDTEGDTTTEDTYLTCIWASFNKRIKSAQTPKSAETKACEELEMYLKESLIPRSACPLQWWREHRHIYPSLYSLFLSHSNIILTSVPCEREFSKAGYIITDRRTRLTTSKVTQIMFLNSNGFNENH